jgi:hypothetical protein
LACYKFHSCFSDANPQLVAEISSGGQSLPVIRWFLADPMPRFRTGRVAWVTIASAHLRGALEKFMVFNFDQVHNYFERLVFEDVARKAEEYPDFTMDMLGDVACVALNRLPARYVRHDVDMMFYLTEQERHAIELSMDEALQFAFGFVQERAIKTGR